MSGFASSCVYVSAFEQPPDQDDDGIDDFDDDSDGDGIPDYTDPTPNGDGDTGGGDTGDNGFGLPDSEDRDTSSDLDLGGGCAPSQDYVNGVCVNPLGIPSTPQICKESFADCHYDSSAVHPCDDYATGCVADNGWAVVPNEQTLPDPVDLDTWDVDNPVDNPSGVASGGDYVPPDPTAFVPPIDPFVPTPNPTSNPTSGGAYVPPSAGYIPPSFTEPSTGDLTELTNVNKSIARLLQDERVVELAQMLGYLHSLDSNSDMALQYQADNQLRFDELIKLAGLSNLSAQQSTDLLLKRGDLTNENLRSIFDAIDWGNQVQTTKLQNIDLNTKTGNLLLGQLNDSSKVLEHNTSKIAGDLEYSNALSQLTNEQLKTQIDTEITREGEAQARRDSDQSDLDGYAIPTFSTDIGASIDSITNVASSDSADFINDSAHNILIQGAIDGFMALLPPLPSSTCSGGINTTIFGRAINIDPCDKLQPLRTALAWVFAFLVFRQSFNHLFQSKG